MSLNILLLAPTMGTASYLLEDLARNNSDDVLRCDLKRLRLFMMAGTAIYAGTDAHHCHFDQVFVCPGLYRTEELHNQLMLVSPYISDCVPWDWRVMLLE